MRYIQVVADRMFVIFTLISVALASAATEDIYFENVSKADTRRSLEASPQDELVLNLKRRNGDDVELKLKENRAINVNAPVYEAMYENGRHRAVLKRSQAIEGVRFYRDLDKKAAFQVRCEPTPNGECLRQIEGAVEVNGETYDVKPKKRTSRLSARLSGNNSEYSHILTRTEFKEDYDDITSNMGGNEMLKRKFEGLIQRRQEHKVYTVETIIAIDPRLWEQFVKRALNKYRTTDETEAEKEARRYYSTLINLVSMAYEGIGHPDFTIKIVISGFLFLKTQTPKMLEEGVYNEDGTHREGVHFGEFLSSMYKEMRENGDLPNADHVYTFTYWGAQGVAGANCLGCICETRSWGWSTSGATSLSYEARTTAHEFGHGLGLYHIAIDNYKDMKCDPDDGYVMGTTVVGRYWKFSECSIRELQVYLAETGHTCLLDNADVYNNNEWNAYTNKMPGEIRNITEQCMDINNGKLVIDQEKESVLCNDVTDPDFCYDMYCVRENDCFNIAAADGTPCGLPSSDKWCIASECVSKTGSTVTPQTTGDAENCYKTWAETYLGTKSTAKSGYTCQRWDSDNPHSHNDDITEKFLDASVADAANYCRDPTARGKPWCFLDARWDQCAVPECSSDRERECAEEIWQYQKMLSETKSGIPCQRWDSQSPHSHSFTDGSDFPDETLADAGNFCRNPDDEPSAWCYTSDENKRWDYCATKKCTDDSCYSKDIDYTGTIYMTKGGIPCQNWDSDTPNENYYKGSAEGNVCRHHGEEFPWCYLEKSWDYCDIPKCS